MDYMIITSEILLNILYHRNALLLMYGPNISFINDTIQLCSYRRLHSHKMTYYSKNNIYHIDLSKYKKEMIIPLLKELCSSPTFYSTENFKKVIILDLIMFSEIRYFIKVRLLFI